MGNGMNDYPKNYSDIIFTFRIVWESGQSENRAVHAKDESSSRAAIYKNLEPLIPDSVLLLARGAFLNGMK